MEKIELKDVIGYFPYNLGWIEENEDGITTEEYKNYIDLSEDYSHVLHGNARPILRPISDLYKTIKHKGKEIIPLVELAKIAFPDWEWNDNLKVKEYITAAIESNDYEFQFIGGDFVINDVYIAQNQYKLFDFLHELHIDYRGLIDKGLAIDINTLSYENNN